MKVIVHVEKTPGEKSCSCYIDGMFDGCALMGYGKTPEKAVEDMLALRQEYIAMGKDIPELEMSFKYDLWAFFDKYPLNISMVAAKIGINASLMRQYVAGLRKPGRKRLGQIQDGIRRLGREMQAATLEA